MPTVYECLLKANEAIRQSNRVLHACQMQTQQAQTMIDASRWLLAQSREVETPMPEWRKPQED